MSNSEHPPRPRLSLNVGVTGHRPKDLTEANLDKLREKIREVLELLKNFACNVADLENYYTNPQEPLLRVLSALAEGADRHVVYQALALGFELQSPLPFDCEEYKKDFASEGSVLEFENLLCHPSTTAVLELDGSRTREADAYLAAGRVVLSQSDVLIAIWNGEMRDKKGGTSQIVSEAKQRNLPTIWVDSQAPHNVYLRISDSNWDPWAVGAGSLVIRLEALLRPPGKSKEDEHGTLAAGYFSETQPSYNWGCLWLPFRNLCADGRWTLPSLLLPQFDQSGRKEWQPILQQAAAFSDETVRTLEAANLYEHYGWADGLAGYYGNLYRSAFVVNYLLGALAVFFAFLHFAFKAYHHIDWVFTACELAALGSITIIFRFGTRGHWHERWVDYRLLAEYLRQLFFLAPLGPGELSAPHIPAHMATGDPRSTWMHWHYRAARRAIGMIRVRFTADYLESIRALLTSQNSIGGQVDYHEKNAKHFESLDKRFVRLINILFILAILAALSALAPEKIAGWVRCLLPIRAWTASPLLPEAIIGLLAVIATVSPAIGAALAGIRSQGEFERVKKRSQAMVRWLKHISNRLDASKGDAPISSATLSAIIAEAGQLMVDELMDWRIVFKDRPLPEPE